MAINYVEFDTTPANLTADLKARVLAHPDWSAHPVTNLSTTLTAATVGTGSTVTLASVTGLVPGSVIVINPGAVNEVRRTVISVAGLVVTMNGTAVNVYPIGTVVRTELDVVRCTTTRGCDIILDLGADYTPNASYGIAIMRAFTGNGIDGWVDRSPFFLWYRSAPLVGAVLHVVLSIGKDHIYLSIEGPRPWEPNPTSVSYGSLKHYFAVSDLVPYHASDTVPAVVAIGPSVNSATSSTANNNHQAAISLATTGGSPWHAVRLATLTFPTIYASDIVPVNRQCSIDGETYLLPYVVFSEVEGIRGRLARFFYANTNAPSPPLDYPDPVGTRVEFEGITYRMNTPSKGDGTLAAWGPFGSVLNTGTGVARSPIVAVPRLQA